MAQPKHKRKEYIDARSDVQGWWAAIRRGGFDRGLPTNALLWLHYKPGLQYKAAGNFAYFDFMGRRTEHDRPFDATLEPEAGKVEPLCVQALDSICALSKMAGGDEDASPNCTWNRTVIRDASPKTLWAAGLPYIFVNKAQRDGKWARYTVGAKVSVVLAWVFVAVPGVLLSLFMTSKSQPAGKDVEMYLPLPHGDGRFPRLAVNFRENRRCSSQDGVASSSWSAPEAGMYRAYQPKFLYFLERRESGRIEPVLRPVRRDDNTPYLFIAYTSEHYGRDPNDGVTLVGMATFAAARFFRKHYGVWCHTDSNEDDIWGKDWDPEQNPGAFWLADGCLNENVEVDEQGVPHELDRHATGYLKARERLANEDTYSISDIIQGALCVCVIAGNPSRRRQRRDDALKAWGQRVWTLAEIVLSRGGSVMVQHPGPSPSTTTYEEIPKTKFAARAWSDAMTSRQLLDNYGSLRLSRLQLAKVALECLMSRKFRALHAGDRIYAMMSLLHIRPPIDRRDSSFQALARLSFPQDSDRLMERLVCLLPNHAEESWEAMTDQYRASVWNIHPTIQVCAVGENDTVVIDGAKGAQIQWSSFSAVRTTRRVTAVRQCISMAIEYCPALVLVALLVVGSAGDGTVQRTGGIAMLAVAVLAVLCIPAVAPLMYRGKLWSVEPCFFGIEGYVPLDVVEARLFGRGLNRMRWSPYGSPLSRHREGEALRERAAPCGGSSEDQDVEETSCRGFVDTYMVEPIDPCSPCSACRDGGTHCKFHETPASCQDRSRSRMGEMKVFTLVDTFSMTATLFHAVRPPTALVVCGSEGGMKRAIACSLDVTTGTLYRETVLRIPSRCVDHMASLERVRLGLRRPLLPTDVELSASSSSSLSPSPVRSEGVPLQTSRPGAETSTTSLLMQEIPRPRPPTGVPSGQQQTRPSAASSDLGARNEGR